MSVLAPTGNANIVWVYDHGVSGESRTIEKQMEDIRKHESSSIVLGWRKTLKDRVEELLRKYSVADWNNEDAVALRRESGEWTKRFIDWLPDGVQIPDIAPEPTGDITLEWSTENSILFSITISERVAIYAGLLGLGSKRHGEELLADQLPNPIREILQNYFCKA